MEIVHIDFRHMFTSLGRHKCYQTNSVVWNKNHNLKLYILNENPYKHLRQWQFIHAIIAGFIIFAITEHLNHFVYVCVCAVWCFVTFCYWPTLSIFLQWCHNGSDGVSNHQPRDCSFKRLFGRRSKNAYVIGRIYNGSVIKYWRSCTPSCSIGECAVPGLNVTFCFLWFTNCVLLFDKNLILGCFQFSSIVSFVLFPEFEERYMLNHTSAQYDYHWKLLISCWFGLCLNKQVFKWTISWIFVRRHLI